MQLHIDSFSDLKVTDRGPSAKIKCGNNSYFVNEDPANLVGKNVEAEVTEKTSAKGNKYSVAKITKVYEATAANSNGNNNGAITWDAYRAMAEAAHELAMKLEPDDVNDEGKMTSDRSAARAAILNTVMIAYSNGKIFVPEEEDDIPPF